MNVDMEEQIALIWNALVSYREDLIRGKEYDSEWGDICTAMAHIQEGLGMEEKLDGEEV
jgi:hypothetical protein